MSLTRNPFFSNEFYFFKAVINPLLLMTLSPLSTVVIVNKIQFLLSNQFFPLSIITREL